MWGLSCPCSHDGSTAATAAMMKAVSGSFKVAIFSFDHDHLCRFAEKFQLFLRFQRTSGKNTILESLDPSQYQNSVS